MQAITYAAYDSLNTILAIPLKEVFDQTYNKFVQLFPDKHIGRVGGGIIDISPQITISTYKSLKNCSFEKCQLLLADEVQCVTGEKTLADFMQIRPIRSFGYTATDEHLFNNADKLIKGLFGERLIYIDYEQSVGDAAVVPGVVYFVCTSPDNMVTARTMEGKINQGIKQAKHRNQLIGQVCSAVPNGWQTMVFVDHIADHLINVYKEMPEGTKFVHRNSDKGLKEFALTAKQQKKVIKDFSENEFQFLIATDMARAGLDVPNCRVVVQASGGTSEVEILQEAFRGSRTLPEKRRQELSVDPKTHFVLIDIMDRHCETLENMSMKRHDIYVKQGWKVKIVNSVNEIDWHSFGKEQNN